MWVLIFGVALILTISLAFLASVSIEYEDVIFFIGVVTLAITIVALIGIIFTSVDVVKGRVLDDKIGMYTEENKEIEVQVGTLVRQYMNYESETIDKVKTEDSIQLVSLYPELKSDSLVKEQIKIYTSNKKNIIKLKEQKIDLKVSKWWLYFGK